MASSILYGNLAAIVQALLSLKLNVLVGQISELFKILISFLIRTDLIQYVHGKEIILWKDRGAR